MTASHTAGNPPKAVLRQRLLQRGLPRLCLFFLGLMVTLPFLQPIRLLPILHFYNEWLALVSGLGAGIALLAYRFWEKPTIPKFAVHLSALVALIAVQTFFIKPAYAAQALLPVLYLAWAILLAVLVNWLREQLGRETILRVLAHCLFLGGLVHALFGAAQFVGLYGWLDGIIEPRQIANITGNIGQQNHLATHIMLATLAMAYLFALRRLSWGLTIPMLALFAFVLASTGSRSVVLYALGGFVLSVLAYRNTGDEAHRRLTWLTGLLLVFFLLYQYSLSSLDEWTKVLLAHLGLDTEYLDPLTATQRGLSGIEQRLVEWHKAWLMFLDAPLLGIGIGNYGWYSFSLHALPAFADAGAKYELAHHAHNIFMEVLAELGLFGLLLLSFLLIAWLRQFLKDWLTPEGWYTAAVLLVLFIHSNLEYPHWYSYFLGIMAVFLALGDNRKVNVSFTPRLGQACAAVSLMLLSAILVMTLGGYRHLANIDLVIFAQSPEHAARTLRAVSANPLLTPWAEITMLARGRPDKANIEQQLILAKRVTHYQPTHANTRQQIIYLALAGKESEAMSLFRHSAHVYAAALPRYICVFKIRSDRELLPLIAEGERLLGEVPDCRTQDKGRHRPFPDGDTS